MTKEEAIRKALQESREEAGLSQSQAGEKLGLSRQSISQYENSGSLNMSSYFALCEVYETSPVKMMEKIENILKESKKMIKNIDKYVVEYGDKYQEDREFFESFEEAKEYAEYIWDKHYTDLERKHNHVYVYFLEREIEQDGEIMEDSHSDQEMFDSEIEKKKIYLDEAEMEKIFDFDSNDFPQIKEDRKGHYVMSRSEYNWLVDLTDALYWVEDAVDGELLTERYAEEIDEYNDFIDLSEDIQNIFKAIDAKKLSYDDIEEPMSVHELKDLASEL